MPAQDKVEEEIRRQLEPYSVVEIKYVADRLGLAITRVEKKMALMVLDKTFYGCLDQSKGVVYVRQNPKSEEGYNNAVSIIHALSDAMDGSYKLAHKLRMMETRVKPEPPVRNEPKRAQRKKRRQSTNSMSSNSSVQSNASVGRSPKATPGRKK